MAIFKCKMCGGTLNVDEGMTVCECEYCGTAQTLPKLDNEKRNQLFDRANHYRMNKEFDKASVVYENILAETPNEAEAHWGMCLCRYGIEYVVDPKTNKRIPTCHRTQFKSILEDDDYLSAVKNCDGIARAIYNSEAMYIDNVQKQILEISSKEEPFDIFICYKESDNAGNRTTDSVVAQDIYNELTNQGYKVFFARITLEDKLGSAYEPYIFAALNSSKIMLVVGTKPEYFNAVWVKNEWSRYLSLIEQGQKKTLIPCYRDMTPYDLPDEFVALQSQDVSKVGYMQDLMRGIEKILGKGAKKTVVKETVASSGNTNIAPLMKRVFMFLEDGDWLNANAYCEKVLDIEPECAQAYFAKLLAELRINKEENLPDVKKDISGMDNYRKAYRFGDNSFKKKLENYNKQAIYNSAYEIMSNAKNYVDFHSARDIFEQIIDFADSKQKAIECQNKAKEYLEKNELIKKEEKYKLALRHQRNDTIKELKIAINVYDSLKNFKDALEQIEKCNARIEELKSEGERQKKEQERQAEIARKEAAKQAKKKKIIGIASCTTAAAVIAFFIVLNKVIIPNNNYNKAMDLYNNGNYEEAVSAFEDMKGYKDSKNMAEKCTDLILSYDNAKQLFERGKYEEAIVLFETLNGYKDSKALLDQCEEQISELETLYNNAMELFNNEKYNEAIQSFSNIKRYKDSSEMIGKCNKNINNESLYNEAVELLNDKYYCDAIEKFKSLGEYKDSEEKAIQATERFRNMVIGDTFMMGKAVSHDIEWQIIDKQENKMLAITKDIINTQNCYSFDSHKAINWEQNYINTWLNTEFYETLSNVQKSKILLSKVDNISNCYFFLLSLDELNKYFPDTSSRIVQFKDKDCEWWLRSSGSEDGCNMIVTENGLIDDRSYDWSDIGVRPAVWLSLDEQ